MSIAKNEQRIIRSAPLINRIVCDTSKIDVRDDYEERADTEKRETLQRGTAVVDPPAGAFSPLVMRTSCICQVGLNRPIEHGRTERPGQGEWKKQPPRRPYHYVNSRRRTTWNKSSPEENSSCGTQLNKRKGKISKTHRIRPNITYCRVGLSQY